MDGDLCEPSLQFQVLPLLNSHVRVPRAVANRVTEELYRHLASIADAAPLAFEKRVLPMRGKEQKSSLEADVLKVC
jgi:hypothetical protein